jgi:hypothetical protein
VHPEARVADLVGGWAVAISEAGQRAAREASPGRGARLLRRLPTAREADDLGDRRLDVPAEVQRKAKCPRAVATRRLPRGSGPSRRRKAIDVPMSPGSSWT